MRKLKQMGIFTWLIILCKLSLLVSSEEFVVNITETLTTDAPVTTLEPNENFFYTQQTEFGNETSLIPSETTTQQPTTEPTENVTSGARRGRLVNGNWDARELALQFQGSPALASGGFMPLLPHAESFLSPPTETPEPVTAPQTQANFLPMIQNKNEEHTDTLEDRILAPFSQPIGNIFIKDAVRKGPDSSSDFAKPSFNIAPGIPPQQTTQSEPKPQFDASQLAMAQAAIQAAQTLFTQHSTNQQPPDTSGPITSSAHQPPSISEPPHPWPPVHHDPQETFISTSDNHFMSMPPPPPPIPPPTLFRDISDPGNKRYGGGNEPYHKYHDLTYNYYGGYPPQPSMPYHHPPPYPQHNGDGKKDILGLKSVVHVFNDFKQNVVGTAHKFGEKIASIASPHKLASLVPVATTLLVGGLALKLLTTPKSDSFNNTLPLISLGGKRRRRNAINGDDINGMLVFEKLPSIRRGSEAFFKKNINTIRRKREANSHEKRLVFAFDNSNPVYNSRKKRSNPTKYLVFDFQHTIPKENSNPVNPVYNSRKKRSDPTKYLVFDFQHLIPKENTQNSHPRKKRSSNEKIATEKSNSTQEALQRSEDGTFTEDELNSLINRLDPVQRQFLQKLQYYGFDRWKEMPCAKFILCDVIIHSDFQHIYDLQRRIGLFLSLMDDESARKVEVMIKDLILAIESRDCSQFYCQMETSQVYRPPPMPHLPHLHHGSYAPTWWGHISTHYRHPYSFPKSSLDQEITHERI